MKNWPKAELHCHLDGSLNLELVKNICERENIPLPIEDASKLKEYFFCEDENQSLEQHLSLFDFAASVLQDKKSLQEAAYFLGKEAAEENVKYLEIRFAPLLHIEKGLTVSEVIQNVIAGAKQAQEEFEIVVNIIICFRRSTDLDKIKPVLDEAAKFLGKGLVAMDVVGFEQPGDVLKYKPVVEYGRKLGYKVTFHCGEMCEPVPNVIDTIKGIKPDRLGHAFQTHKDKETEEVLLNSNIPVEMAPYSNLHYYKTNPQDYPFLKYLRAGALITINTDNRRITNGKLTDNIEIMVKEYGMTPEDYKQVYTNAVNSAFTDDKTKEWLMSFVDEIK